MRTRRTFLKAAAAAATFATLNPAPGAKGEDMPDEPRPVPPAVPAVPADRPIRIGAVVFPRMDQVDLTGPFAVLSRLPNASVQLLWKEAGVVRDHRGLGLMPDATFADADADGRPIDLLMITGGPGQEGLMEDEAVLSFVAKRAAAATLVFSVCTGALLCGAAGLLKGRRATTHWASFHLLKYFGATPTDRRVVVDGSLVTAAGLTAGIDGALTVAAMLRGEEAARAITLDIQYAPEPPFDCGTPQKAAAGTLERVRGASAKLTAHRLATARRAAARLGVRVEE